MATVYTTDTPAGSQSDYNLGCPIDTDGDGVVDGIDQVSLVL